ncbi:helix-turn-helix domain-containing protein [Brevundimonas sp. TWP2-3-4b1]|uniref:helix-turn-helix domain-containing protein n=1 Tax=Brevundimonas sp. TWP2-3-4b1 TaxID=2804580 RepID=UPI003CEB00A6
MTERDSPFQAMGLLLAEARAAKGLNKQADLAAALGVSQQTVSRWEAGTSRPRAQQLGPVAEFLDIPIDALRRVAGYDAPAVATFVAPLPTHQLTADAFEQFTRELIQAAHPTWTVRRAGGPGHTQYGADVVATTPDGAVVDYQCKRVEQFGPSHVTAVVKAYQGQAERRVLVLSRTASPDTARALADHDHWSLLDRDDLSSLLRTLPVAEQDRLVDIFFRGQRLALLGRSEPGPWLTTEEFFRPFLQDGSAFSHGWDLIGRDAELMAITDAVTAQHARVTLVTGAGGMGKSRVLREAMARIQALEPRVFLRFLSGSEEVTREAIGHLGAGPKIIVVDDAHDRDGLAVVLQYVADPDNDARLVLASRPYAVDRIQRSAAVSGLADIVTINLNLLPKSDLQDLAGRVLAAFGARDDWAEDVVRMAGGSPLIAAMAAQAFAREPMASERLRGQAGLRNLVLGKFEKVITGDLEGTSDASVNRAVLRVLALVQPFHPGDNQLIDLLVATTGFQAFDIERALKTLVSGAVVLKRGHQYRLMPDVLSDYLVDENCLTSDHKLSRFADEVIAAAPPAILAHVLVNLGRLDWRVLDGDTTNSRLLATVWRSFETITTGYDDRLDAIKSVAIFQPRQALDFVAGRVSAGETWSVLADILRNIAYSGHALEEVAEVLWRMGRVDERDTGPNPSHPLRVLIELAAFQDRKPLSFNEQLLEFALARSAEPESWSGSHTPLDLMKPFLSAEGMLTRSDQFTVTLTRFLHHYEVVQPFRARVVERLFELLRDGNLRVARLTGVAFADALRGPFGLLNSETPKSVIETYEAEFDQTLARLRKEVAKGLPASTLLAIAASVVWHVRHGGANAKAAAAVLKAMPNDLDFRTRSALVDGWGNIFVKAANPGRWRDQLQIWIDPIAADILAAYPEPEDRRAYLEAALDEMNASGHPLSSAHVLMQTVLQDQPAFARALIRDAEARPRSATASFCAGALSTLIRHDLTEARIVARRWLESANPTLQRSVPNAYAGEGGRIQDDDVAIIREVLQLGDPHAVSSAIRAVWTWQAFDRARMIDLVLAARIGDDVHLLDEVAMVLSGIDEDEKGTLSEVQAGAFLALAEPMPELRGHWIDEVLAEASFRFPRPTARFFMARVERAAATENYSFRAANHGPYRQTRLRFLESPEGLSILSEVWFWLLNNSDRGFYFDHAAEQIFDAMFLFADDVLVQFLEPKLAAAAEAELRLMGSLLAHVRHRFVFDHTGFVVQLLDRCRPFGATLVKSMITALYSSATSGMRSGMPGKPMPRDLEDRARSEEVLSKLSRMSPAYTLFTYIRDSARRDIDQAVEEGRAMMELGD